MPNTAQDSMPNNSQSDRLPFLAVDHEGDPYPGEDRSRQISVQKKYAKYLQKKISLNLMITRHNPHSGRLSLFVYMHK
jgi:hypothetical protein